MTITEYVKTLDNENIAISTISEDGEMVKYGGAAILAEIPEYLQNMEIDSFWHCDEMEKIAFGDPYDIHIYIKNN